MRLSRAVRGPELQTKRKPKMRMHIITISLLQIRQISEMAGAACHGEGYQCPARWMSLTRAECHSDGGPRGGSEGETSCVHFGEELFATVGAVKQ